MRGEARALARAWGSEAPPAAPLAAAPLDAGALAAARSRSASVNVTCASTACAARQPPHGVARAPDGRGDCGCGCAARLRACSASRRRGPALALFCSFDLSFSAFSRASSARRLSGLSDAMVPRTATRHGATWTRSALVVPTLPGFRRAAGAQRGTRLPQNTCKRRMRCIQRPLQKFGRRSSTGGVGIARGSAGALRRSALQLARHKLAGGRAHDDDVALLHKPRHLAWPLAVSNTRTQNTGLASRACSAAPLINVAVFSWLPSLRSFCACAVPQSATA